MRIGRVEVEPIAKEAAQEFRDDDVPGLAAQTAYQLIFSLPPAAIFFAALSAIVDRYTGVDVFGRLLDILRGALPGDVYQPVDTIISQIRRGGAGLLSIGFVVALWSAAGAVDALIKAFNVAYDVIDQRSFVKRKAMDIGLTIGLGVLVIAAFVLFVFGQRLALWLAGYAGLGSA
ncbi:MAG: YihY/virulence factor BrkB family protein, partial [Thermomicrobiaceae bacterium]|nr:YihY/virulence factor BrkB family protein [Thermomicrobiaceae bacterium]